MGNRPSLDDYVDVAERIQDFMDSHPKGRLQRVSWEVREIGSSAFIVYTARAYPDKGADSEDYGEGTAWEPFPGRTPYTKDSELMNAETAAWGRAICALGLVANRKLASRQEVRNRVEDQKADEAVKPAVDIDDGTINHSASREHNAGVIKTIDEDSRKQLGELFEASDATYQDLAWFLVAAGVQSLPVNPSEGDIRKAVRGLTLEQAFKVEALLKGDKEGEAVKNA